ncbi:hypothetical protein [Streptomyces varsoviensis]|nr:hypothetical protein [Streptomyces varsoviensis]
MNTTRHTTGKHYPSMTHWLSAASSEPRAVRALPRGYRADSAP